MAVKKKRIQVPESIASEVKLFAKLLELGEITSVYDLLQELEVVSEIYPPTTKAIFAQKGKLVNFSNNSALIEINCNS